jgi:hypothetical protein
MLSTSSWKLCKELRRAAAVSCLIGAVLLSLPQSSPAWNSASPAWTSASSLGGVGPNTGEAVKVDRDGNRYGTGNFFATAYFPLRAAANMDDEGRATEPASAPKALTSAGGTDVFLAKYDRSGRLRWVIQAGGPGDDSGYDLAFDAAGNVYVTGFFTISATFHGTDGTSTSVTGPGQTIFLAKYSTSGVLAWVQTGQVNSTNQGYGVAVEPVTGTVYVTGVSQGDTTFSSSNGTTHSVAAQIAWHMVLVKYDTAGNFQWGQTNLATPNSVPHGVAVDADDNAYVTGWMEGQTTFRSNNGQDLTVVGFSRPVQNPPDYPNDGFIVKYDENGNVQWVNHIGGYKAIVNDIAVSRDGRVSITGFIGNIANSPVQAETIVTSQPGGNNINLGGGHLTNPYNKDVFFATYDDSGVLLDARRYGGVADEGGSGVAFDRRGNLILAGVFQETINIEGLTLTEPGSSNLFLAKFAGNDQSCSPGNASNTAYWVQAAEGPFVGNFDYGPSIGLTSQGDVLVTGAYQSTAQFGSFKLQSAGVQDGFLALLRASKPAEDEHR